jgi:hypothetical protein
MIFQRRSLLILAGSRQVVAAPRLVDLRNKLAETVEEVDKPLGRGVCSAGG